MIYLTYDEYKLINTGVEVPAEDFNSLEFYAAVIIDNLTMNRIDFETMSVKNVQSVKNAAAVQIAYLHSNGSIDSLLDDRSLKSEKIGNHSYELEGGISSSSGMLSPFVKKILYPTGLLFRGGMYANS